MDFHFKNKPGKHRDTLMFCDESTIIEFNFEKSEPKIAYKFETPLKRQPWAFSPTDTQHIAIIASPEDGVLINMNNKT